MFGGVLRRSLSLGQLVRRCRTPHYSTTACKQDVRDPENPIHPDLMNILVCPLSKEPLRYDGTIKALICDKLGVAYPIMKGLPNLIPQDGWLLTAKDDRQLNSDL